MSGKRVLAHQDNVLFLPKRTCEMVIDADLAELEPEESATTFAISDPWRPPRPLSASTPPSSVPVVLLITGAFVLGLAVMSLVSAVCSADSAPRPARAAPVVISTATLPLSAADLDDAPEQNPSPSTTVRSESHAVAPARSPTRAPIHPRPQASPGARASAAPAASALFARRE
jgi:hypothetical protein